MGAASTACKTCGSANPERAMFGGECGAALVPSRLAEVEELLARTGAPRLHIEHARDEYRAIGAPADAERIEKRLGP